MITTIPSLIEELGGDKAVAAMFGVGRTAVAMVKNRNRIPYRWRIAILREAERRNLKLDPRLLETEAA